MSGVFEVIRIDQLNWPGDVNQPSCSDTPYFLMLALTTRSSGVVVPTPSGHGGSWHPVQVARVIGRYRRAPNAPALISTEAVA